VIKVDDKKTRSKLDNACFSQLVPNASGNYKSHGTDLVSGYKNSNNNSRDPLFEASGILFSSK